MNVLYRNERVIISINQKNCIAFPYTKYFEIKFKLKREDYTKHKIHAIIIDS